MEPDDLRWLVEDAINNHLDQEQLAVLKVAEEDEREWLETQVRLGLKPKRKPKSRR